MFSFFILSLIATYVGIQIQLTELKLLTNRYNYRIHAIQTISIIAATIAVGVSITDIVLKHEEITTIIFESLLSLLFLMLVEWILCRLSPKSRIISTIWRIAEVGIIAISIYMYGSSSIIPFIVIGLWLRNSPLGIVHGKNLYIAYTINSKADENKTAMCDALRNTDKNGIKYNVIDYGIVPNTNKDLTRQVQELIDKVGCIGGGTIYFPKGRYLFNISGKKEFLQINHSHITIEGECDEKGCLLTELVNCGTTVRGEHNPWLSPFFITTGEAIQPSNIFWGLDFRRPKHIHMESSSLSDPGSDGHILKPPFATTITADLMAGDTILQVADSTAVGKYILIGMYNTSSDGNLIKELIGTETMRPEWLSAHRAGPEEAPSFQWLTEVRRVIDSHTIELCQPLLIDCLRKYEPAIFNVEMLEDIHIQHLRINSRWNGLFHHHGIPLYYSISQSQEMDYGWNGINMKRAAHSSIYNVEIRNFTNPLYIQDSYDTNINHVIVEGYDGHQGLKVYCHTSNCMFSNITFRCHFADMMGGEGNSYCNTFSNIVYDNPTFNPVDFDFHGFSSPSMSPPAWNHFDHVYGFRYIKAAGAVFMQPAMGIGNTWTECPMYGEKSGTSHLYAMSYRMRGPIEKYITAIGYTIAVCLKKRKISLSFITKTLQYKVKDIEYMSIPRELHPQLFPHYKLEQDNVIKQHLQL